MKSVTIENIFDKAQINTIHHNRLLPKLLELHDKENSQEFQKKFLLCLKHALANGEKAPAVRIFDFASKFCALLECQKSSTVERNNLNGTSDDDDEEPMNPFVSDIFKELLKLHGSRSQNVRMRVCYCLKRILQCLGPEASIDSDICEEIFAAMLERLKDKSPTVRAQAVTALERLQDPSDVECPIVKAFIFHVSMDPSAEVRRAVLLCLGRSKQSLPHIRNRIYDAKDTVRKQAYLSLSKVTVRSHSIKNRELILSQGLKDRSDTVQDTVSTVLLPNWLENCQGNFVEFLHVLDVENSEISEEALKILLKSKVKEELIGTLQLNSEKLVPPEKLSVELSFFWRCLAEFLQSEEDGQWELVLPELSMFCEYVKRNLDRLKEINKLDKLEAWDYNQNDFIVLQLLHMTKVFDLGDETGREKLKQLLIEMLMSSDVRLKLIPSIMDILVKVVPDVDARLILVAETISEVHDPLIEEQVQDLPPEERRNLDFKLAQLRLQKNILEEDLSIAVQDKNFLQAEDLKNNLTKITEELASLSVVPANKEPMVANRAEDPGILSKCLTIVYEMMQSPSVKSLSPQLRSLMDNFVKNSLKVEHAVVQVLALQCFAVFSLLDESIAKEVIVVFCLYLGSSCDEIAQVAIKGIFDLLLMYGLKTFAIEEEEDNVLDETFSPRKKQKKNLMRQSTFINDDGDESDNNEDVDQTLMNDDGTSDVERRDYLLSLLTKHLDSTQGQTLCYVVEGLCKLLLAMRISAPKLLSRLIILWFNPVHEDDTYLRQLLGQFFKTYATACPISQETIEQCFIPTINTVLHAPCSSPLSQISVEVVAKFLLDLTKCGVNKYCGEVNIHNNLALQLCNELLKDNYDQIQHELINILCHMELALDGDMKINIQKMAQRIRKNCPDRNSIRAIQKFQNILDSVSETGQRVTETVVEERTASESADLMNGTVCSGKRGSSLVASESNGGSDGSFSRTKALKTASDSMIPSTSDLMGIIPETSESDNDSVFENGEE